jgi:hypothetical protein
MRRPAKPQSSSPRFPRGLELWLWIACLGLLLHGILHHQPESKAVVKHPVPVVSPKYQFATHEGFDRPLARQKTPREILVEHMAAIDTEEDMDQRGEKLVAFAQEIPLADIASTIEELQNIGRADSDLCLRLLRRWAAGDGGAAAAWAEQLPAGPARENALSSVAIEWANADLKSAAAWARQLPDKLESHAALLAVANEAVRTEPLAALRLVVNLPADAGRDDLIHRAAMDWTTQDADAAVTWTETIPDDALRVQVLSDEAVALAQQNPVMAATVAVEKLPAGQLQEGAVISIIERWAQRDPEAAAEWVAQFPASPLRATAIENLMRQWSQIDAESAEQWRVAHS